MREPVTGLAELERRHKAGDRRAVLDALFVCLCAHPPKPVPDWARRAYRKAYGRGFGALAGSWDDVFGPLLKPRERLAAKRRRKLLETPVWRRIRQRHANGEPVDDRLFAEVGNEFGIGARQCKELFYAMERAGWCHSNLWDLRPEDFRRRRKIRCG
jgi:hypothetical protein